LHLLSDIWLSLTTLTLKQNWLLFGRLLLVNN
jgi:hypothetical protein